jgi:hypothetical protein
MKTKIFGGIAILSIAVAAAFNVSVSNQKSDKTSMLALANVEVLADAEETFPGNWQCTTTTSSVQTYMYCGESLRLASMVTTYNCTSGLYGNCQEGEVTYSCDCSGVFTGSYNLINKQC